MCRVGAVVETREYSGYLEKGEAANRGMERESWAPASMNRTYTG